MAAAAHCGSPTGTSRSMGPVVTRSMSPKSVCRAIRRVAEDLGARPERLLMVDYQQRASDDDSLPTLSDVFGAYGSWKRARRAAAG